MGDVWDRQVDEILDNPERWLRAKASEMYRDGSGRTDQANAAIMVLILWRRLDAIDDSLRQLLEKA